MIEVICDHVRPGHHVFDGDRLIATFYGPDATPRAQEYAAWLKKKLEPPKPDDDVIAGDCNWAHYNR